MLTASSTVDGDAVAMETYNDSEHAQVPLTVVNTRGPELPKTGDDGVWRYSVYGILLMAAAACVIVLVLKNKKKAPGEK